MLRIMIIVKVKKTIAEKILREIPFGELLNRAVKDLL